MTASPRPLKPVDGFLVLLLAALDFRLYIVLSQAVFPNNPSAGIEIPFKTSVMILMGEPPWRVFQGRVLTPWAMELLHLAGFAYVPAFLSVILLLTVLKNAVALRVFAGLTGDRAQAWALTLSVAAGFWLIQNGQPLYPWDFVEFIVGLLLVFGVGAGRGVGFFLLVFAIAIFNRESALFIGLLVLLRGLLPASRGDRLFVWSAIDRAQAALGIAMMAAGAIIVEGLRTWLFVRSSMLEGILYSGIEYNPYAQVKLLPNWEMFVKGVTQFPDLLSPFINLFFVIDGLILVALGLAAWRFRWLMRREPALFLTFVAELGAILIFGTIHEGRVYAGLVPPAVYLTWRLIGGEPRRA